MWLTIDSRQRPCQAELSSGGERSPPGGLAVADELEQIAVGVQEVETVVVAPVDGRVVGNAFGLERLKGAAEILGGDLEGVVALAERVFDLLEAARRAPGLEEERAAPVPVTEQHLIGQAHPDAHAEEPGVEALGPLEVGDVHPEVIEALELQHQRSSSVAKVAPAARISSMARSPSPGLTSTAPIASWRTTTWNPSWSASRAVDFTQ